VWTIEWHLDLGKLPYIFVAFGVTFGGSGESIGLGGGGSFVDYGDSSHTFTPMDDGCSADGMTSAPRSAPAGTTAVRVQDRAGQSSVICAGDVGTRDCYAAILL
jgi:hypothetical protein